MRRLHSISLSLVAFLLPVAAQSQHDHSARTEGPAVLLPGMGNVSHPIQTTNPEAQKFFDQGLALIYGFNHDEAARAFRRAAELDPASPMPHWGVALALGPNINLDVDPAREKAAYDEAHKAMDLAAGAPPNEQGYVRALAIRYSLDPRADLKKLAVDYKNAMGELVGALPDDLDAATLYAESMMDLRPWHLWNADGSPAEGTLEIVSVLESVLKRDSNHLGANHYYIHAVEASPQPERALSAASRLEHLAPAAGHLTHMPGHIYLRTGDFASAVNTNQVAAEADRKYIRETRAQGIYPLMYYTHNLHFILFANQERGVFSEAMKAGDAMVANVRPAANEMTMAQSFLVVPSFVLLRFGRWDNVLMLPAPPRSQLLPVTFWHFARGVAQAGKGNATEAQAELGRMEEAAKQLPSNASFSLSPASKVVAVAREILAARIAAARKQTPEAIQHWHAAVEAQDALGYDEPPNWYYSTRESLGAALFLDGQIAEAERVFRDNLDRNPRAPRSLFGLRESLKAQKKPGVDWVDREFKTAWKDAEIELRMEDL